MRIPRWLLIPCMLIFALYWTEDIWQGNSEPSVFDLPKTLEDEQYSLEVYPVSNVNNVAIFTTSVGNSDSYLYLTPASNGSVFPHNFKELRDSGYQIKVTGKFYKGKAIPIEYLDAKPKPERLRVFQFEKLEMVQPKHESVI